MLFNYERLTKFAQAVEEVKKANPAWVAVWQKDTAAR